MPDLNKRYKRNVGTFYLAKLMVIAATAISAFLSISSLNEHILHFFNIEVLPLEG